MAIYHFSGTIISRSQGRSAIACAAYRSGEELHDERLDKTYDYTRKQDIEHTEILLPTGAPEWMSDRQKLWNFVEATENRKDAQLSREFNFSLPRELSIENNITLTREFVQKNFVDKGMVADIAIHNDKMPDGQMQPHAHVMLTMREVTPDGFGKKVREWNDKALLMEWREVWGETANRHLLLNGIDIKIDHRTLEAQGIDLEPQYKIGASVARDKLARLEDHQRIAFENGERIFKDPGIALNAITHQQSTFTQQDLARFINRHSIDSDQFQRVFEVVKASNEIVSLGKDDNQKERFTTREMLAVESKMMDHSKELSQAQNHAVSENSKTKALNSKQLTVEQTEAFNHITKSDDLSCVIGFAGTGKSYLLGAAREAFENEGYRVVGATLSGIAAENLTGSSGIESRTLASRFYYWEKGEQLLNKKDILVIDEAGMIGSRLMGKVLEHVKTSGAKAVLVGDPEQLQAIEAGAAFRSISEQSGFASLTDIRRQVTPWQKEATIELATGKTPDALKRYDQHQHLHAFKTKTEAQDNLMQLWNDARISDPSKTQIILSYTRADARDLNDKARSLRHNLGELGTDHTIVTEKGQQQFANHDRIYFLKNDRNLGVMNGTLGTIEKIHNKTMTIMLDQDERNPDKQARTININLDKYNHIDHGYAATIHKGQGVTVDRSYVLASKYFNRHATYVSATRHRSSCDIFYDHESFSNKAELIKTLSRERSKDITLDYGDLRCIEKDTVAPNIIVKPQSMGSPETDIQSKLRAFTEHAKAIQEKQFAVTANHLPGIARRDSLDDFKKQFEAKNPALAASLSRNTMTEAEKRAQASMKEFKKLEAMVEKGDRTSHLAKSHLQTLAGKIASQKEVMQTVRDRDPNMEKQIQKINKEISRERDFEMER